MSKPKRFHLGAFKAVAFGMSLICIFPALIVGGNSSSENAPLEMLAVFVFAVAVFAIFPAVIWGFIRGDWSKTEKQQQKVHAAALQKENKKLQEQLELQKLQKENEELKAKLKDQ